MFRKILLSLISVSSLVNATYIGKIYYDSNTRTVYVKPINKYDNPTIYFAGAYITGNCVKPKKYVYQMNYTPISEISDNIKRNLDININNGVVKAGTSKNYTNKYSKGKVWSYNFNSMIIKNLHFNIKVDRKRDGKSVQSGWKPDSSGGCTYTIQK